jgi:hypothetical protein
VWRPIADAEGAVPSPPANSKVLVVGGTVPQQEDLRSAFKNLLAVDHDAATGEEFHTHMVRQVPSIMSSGSHRHVAKPTMLTQSWPVKRMGFFQPSGWSRHSSPAHTARAIFPGQW